MANTGAGLQSLIESGKATRFQKGQSGHAGRGRRQRNPTKKLERAEPGSLNRICRALFSENQEVLAALTRDPTVTPMEKLVIAVYVTALQKGDHVAMEAILNRFMGKVRESIEVKTVSTDINDYRELTDEELLRRRELLVSLNE